MVETSDMIIGSLSKIWHLVPIVIFIILFKKFLNKKDKDRRILKNEENEKQGLGLEIRIIKKYEDLGYKVDKVEEKGIDLISSKDDKKVLIHYKDSSKTASITQHDIKRFCSDAIKYIEANDIKKSNTTFRYIVPYGDILDKSAIKTLMNNSYNCGYVVV